MLAYERKDSGICAVLVTADFVREETDLDETACLKQSELRVKADEVVRGSFVAAQNARVIGALILLLLPGVQQWESDQE